MAQKRPNLNAQTGALAVSFAVLFALTCALNFNSIQWAEALEDTVASSIQHNADQTVQEIQSLLSQAELSNQFLKSYLETGHARANDVESWQRIFAQAEESFPRVNYFATTDREGAWFGLRTFPPKQYGLAESGKGFSAFSVRDDLGFGQVITTDADYTAATKNWFQRPISSASTTWSDIYMWAGTDIFSMTLSTPYYINGRIGGIVTSDITLESLGEYLQALRVVDGTLIAVVEKNGELVATSLSGSPVLRPDPSQAPKRLHIESHENNTIRAMGLCAMQDDCNALSGFHFDSRPVYDRKGLNWNVLVATPKNRATVFLVGSSRMLTSTLFIGAMILFGCIVFITIRQQQTTISIVAQAHNIERMRLQDDLRAAQAQEPREKRYKQFAPIEMIDRLDAMGIERTLAGMERSICVLYCTIENIETIAGTIPAEEVIASLDPLLRKIQLTIAEHRGLLIDDSIHGLVAVFGAPEESSTAAHKAIQTAQEIRSVFSQYTNLWNTWAALSNEARAVLRIGIAQGPAVMGDFGGYRSNYNALSTAVATAQQLNCAASKLGASILADPTCVRKLPQSAASGASLVQVEDDLDAYKL